MAKDESTDSAQPLKEANTNTVKGSKVQAEAEHAPILLFRPQTGEFIAVPSHERNALNVKIGEWNSMVATLHDANQQVQYFEDHISRLSLVPVPVPGALKEAEDDWKAAVKWQAEVVNTCRAKIESLSKLGSSGKQLYELIPIPGDSKTKKEGKPIEFNDGKLTQERSWSIGTGTKKKRPTREWLRPPMGKLVYVPSTEIKSKWPTFKDPDKIKWNDVVTTDPNGKRKIDSAKLKHYSKQAIKDFQIKSKDFQKFEYDVESSLGSWATAWNTDTANQFTKKGDFVVGHVTGTMEFDAAAQFMRYLYGASLSGTFEPFNRKVAVRAEGHAEIAFAEGKASAAFYFPRKDGWMWTLPTFLTDKGAAAKDIDLGAVRLAAVLELKGAVGASVAVEANLIVEHKNGQLPVVRAEGAPPEGGQVANSVPVELGPEQKMLKAGANVGLNAFAGIKADAELKGAIEWRNPEDAKKSFEAFANVAPAVSALAGIGGNSKLSVEYVRGTFKVTVDAGICIGAGAEGKLTFEVNAMLFASFIKWFFYQLYHANFKKLNFLRQSAFDAARDLLFIAIYNDEKIEKLFGLDAGVIQEAVQTINSELTQAEARQKLAKNIISDPLALRYASPETKGMLIHQLCNDTNINWAKSGFGLGNSFLRPQKEAIKFILRRWSHTKSDCRNVIQHMSANGRKGDFQQNLARLRRFLREEAPQNLDIPGLDSDHGSDFDSWYKGLTALLKDEPTRGFPVTHSDGYQYALQRRENEDHPLFASTGEYAFYV